MSGETCKQVGSCYRPYCTASTYNSLIEKAILMRWSIQSCSGNGCRPTSNCLKNTGVNSSQALDGKYHYHGSYDDSCLPLMKQLVDNGPDTKKKKKKCIETLEYNQEFLDEWNNNCNHDITVTYYAGSMQSNCRECISGSYGSIYICYEP